MNPYNQHKHHRKSIRLAGYDYSQAGLYFITLLCKDRAHLFGEIKNGVMQLNPIGQIAEQEWLHTEEVRENVVLHEFVIMPNHIHGIIEITFSKENNNTIGAFQSPSQTIGSIVRGYKIATIKRIKELLNNKDESDKDESDKGEIYKGEIYKGEKDKDEKDKNNDKGELQFAPTTPTTASTIIKSYNYRIWQRNYYERIIRDEKAYINISNYIINNPKKWEKDQLKKS